MKKFRFLLLCPILLFGFVSAGVISNQDGSDAVYEVNYRYERMYCNFLINNISLHTSVGKNLTVQWSFMDRIGILLKEGINTIGIEGIDLTVADNSSFCEMSIWVHIYNPVNDTFESKEITSLRLTYDENGLFTVEENKSYDKQSLISTPNLEKLDYAFYHKSNKDLQHNVIATKNLEINHPFRTHVWKYKSEPFVDTLENRKKLWEKYETIVAALKSKKQQNIINELQPGMAETENYQGDPQKRSWEKSKIGYYINMWNSDDYNVQLAPQEDMKLILSPDGDLFRFEMKETASSINSPIVVTAFGKKLTINPTFTFVDGKVIVAY
ncbi:hypothetical protein [Ignatzschineria sp. LJL83]